VRRPDPAPVPMALLMVAGAGEPGAVAVRLAQDCGHTDAPAGAPAAPVAKAPPLAASSAGPARRRRGRPAGSRTRKAPATNGHDPLPARTMARAATPADPSHGKSGSGPA
jgi:hypothetical protein